MKQTSTLPNWRTQSPQAEDGSFDPIEMAGKVLALMAALLPASGFLTRAVAFAITFGPDWNIPLAWNAPLPQLAVTGLFSLLLAAPIPVFLWLVWRLEVQREARLRQPRSPDPTKRVQASRLRALVLLLLISIASLVADLLLFPGWPGQLVSAPLGALIIFGPRMSWHRGRRKRFRDIWWVVVLAVVIAAVTAGVFGETLGFTAADYEFAPNATKVLANGRYQQLGEADGFFYLNKCGSTDVYAINGRAITSITERRNPVTFVLPPSLLQVLQGAKGQPLGAPQC